MNRKGILSKVWLALAAIVIGLIGTGEVSQGDLTRLFRSLNQALQSEAPRDTGRGGRPGEVLAGRPRIIDGDTLDVDGVRVRMQGIDALEHDQECRGGNGRFECGAAARQALVELIGGRSVTCVPDGSTTHGRSVAHCSVPRPGGGTLDLNEAMVRSGYAFDCPRFSDGRYAAAEAAAKREKAGAWAGRFDYPWSHRKRSGACDR
ncbi:thermonuclease family protein [Pseudoroseomonas oryzae]|uniref:Thermonuclease family protein n=1 Tax=Teichococcus oryzae TaxID=1608942 RepID=A0A5B2THI0_9PROT|nr:thermonuclease family protein [Pseudoroseomonas oryzae]